MGILTPNIVTTNSIANGLFLARLATAQSITTSTFTSIIFDNEVIDGRSQYNNTTGVFTCSLPGYWQFNTYVRVSSSASITNVLIQILHNTQGYRGNQIVDASSTQTACTLSMGIIIPIAVGDTIQTQVFAASTGTINASLVASVYPSAFSGYLIAPN